LTGVQITVEAHPLWAMGVEHALKTIAHGVGSYKIPLPQRSPDMPAG